MTKFIFSTFSLLLIVSALSAQEATSAHKDSLERIVKSYYDMSIKINAKDSQPADIDALFAMFTDDFTYVHPKYGGVYSRQDLYEGYLSNQRNGGYDGSIVDYQIRNIIIGLNGVTTSRVYLKKTSDEKLEEIDPGMTLFDFENGKISRVSEYW